MTGYQELVTDPSYAEQILCFTAPMVGNYGVCKGRSESGGVHVQGVVMREAQGPAWTDWLVENGVDRARRDRHPLARAAPARPGRDVGGDRHAATRSPQIEGGMEGKALVAGVSTPEPYRYAEVGRVNVAVVDYGTKKSILRRLAGCGRGGDGLSAHGRRRHARRLRRRRPLERPRRPRPARRGDRGRPRPPRPHAGLRHLPRPPAARPRDRARDLQAPLRPPRREPPGARARSRAACSSPRRTTASR